MAFAGPFEDRLAIRELFDAYSDAVCNVDADAWGATWAEDGVWELPDYPEIGKISGKSNIVTAWKAVMAGYPGIVDAGIHHCNRGYGHFALLHVRGVQQGRRD